jgi:hypothetical protein
MTANPWNGVERRVDATHRRRIAIIFDPAAWREKIRGAPGATGVPFAAAQSSSETQQIEAPAMTGQG